MIENHIPVRLPARKIMSTFTEMRQIGVLSVKTTRDQAIEWYSEVGKAYGITIDGKICGIEIDCRGTGLQQDL